MTDDEVAKLKARITKLEVKRVLGEIQKNDKAKRFRERVDAAASKPTPPVKVDPLPKLSPLSGTEEKKALEDETELNVARHEWRESKDRVPHLYKLRKMKNATLALGAVLLLLAIAKVFGWL